jgi:glutathione S-transferase
MADLWGMTVSPYTEKARFALDHHAIVYRYREYVPMLGEPGLRLRLKKPVGKVSVPVLFTNEGAIADSFRIAEHADASGAGPTLFPKEHRADIVAWNDRSEAALGAGRALTIQRLISSPATRMESMPPFIPKAMRPALGSVVGTAFQFVRSKYGAKGDTEGARQTFKASLVALREALGGRQYLLDGFTYADITMSALVAGVKPLGRAYLRMGPATRAAFGDEDLAREFADLVSWRDALYGKHRPKRVRAID